MTGCNGDIGALLASMLEKNKIDFLRYNGDLKGVDRIFHLAAKSPPATHEEIISSNILYLQDIIHKAQNSCVKELIFFSAASVYGNLDTDVVKEDSPFKTPSIYGISKALGEEILKESNIKVLVIRLPAILGDKNTTNIIARWYYRMKKDEEVVYMNGLKLFNNFITVESIFNFLKNFTFGEKFDVVNLASKRTMSIVDVVDYMKYTLGSNSKLIDGGNSPSFAISTQKAEEKYGFIPEDPREALLSWIQKRSSIEA